MCSGVPAWKPLISCPLSTNERIPLIAAVFSDHKGAEVARDLGRDDAQSLVDVVDEVLLLHHFVRKEPVC